MNIYICGIGWYKTTNLTLEQKNKLKYQAKRISHRGPDATEIKEYENEIWAFHRLAIINLDPDGMQPFTSPSGSRLICNGEIYNYRSLMGEIYNARSDCDAILHVLDGIVFTEKNVCDAVYKLDGDFAFVWKNGDDMVIGRDHVGVCPLFYAVDEHDQLIAVASECKALMMVSECDDDSSECDDSNIKVFPPGHVWINGQFHSYQPESIQVDVTREDATQRVRDLITEAVKKRIDHSDRPVGILCSGGWIHRCSHV